MKSSALIAVLVAASLPAALTLAEDKPAKDAPAQVQQQAPNVAEFDKQMAQAQENLQKMQAQMEKIRQTQDPKERERLLKQHWEAMQSNMGMMHGMWGRGMMGGGHMMGGMMGGGRMMGWQGMGDYYSKMTPEQMNQRQYMMDRYMGMQQMMMDHMMQHQNYMWMHTPAKPTK